MRIGLLEDNPGVSDYMSTLLKFEGHTVEDYTHGSCLLHTLFTETGVHLPLPYDLLIVDLLLPGMLSGLQTIQAIRQRLSPAQLPILIVTALSLAEIEEITTGLTTVPLLRKPFQRRVLLQMIADLTGGHDTKDRE